MNQDRDFRILLLEDNLDHRDLVALAFDKADAAVSLTFTETAEETLVRLEAAADHADGAPSLPDLILIDINLPGLSGLDLLKRIKGHEVLRSVPVAILSSSASARDRELAYSNHANSYLVKPILFKELVETARQIVDYWAMRNVPPHLPGT